MAASTVLFMLILGLVLGGMTLMLASGYASTEQERARQEQARRAAAARADIALAVPGFLSPQPPATPVAFVFDDGLVHQLETHVRSEQAVVSQFVHHPSIDTLYRQPARALRLH